MFTKNALQIELKFFLEGFADSIGRVYGRGLGEPLMDKVEESSLWGAVMQMYDYGVQGQPCEGLGDSDDLPDPQYLDATMFLTGLKSLEAFLDEDNVKLPVLAIRAVTMAATRLLLDGGPRTHAGDEDSLWSEHLSIAEVALMADMDVRSVRNATNSKAPDQLHTETVGKRVRVNLEEARRWLAGRKGFVPTRREMTQYPHSPAPEMATLEIPAHILQLLKERAATSGQSVQALIESSLAGQQGQ